jgi:hypothetical protein
LAQTVFLRQGLVNENQFRILRQQSLTAHSARSRAFFKHDCASDARSSTEAFAGTTFPQAGDIM